MWYLFVRKIVYYEWFNIIFDMKMNWDNNLSNWELYIKLYYKEIMGNNEV